MIDRNREHPFFQWISKSKQHSDWGGWVDYSMELHKGVNGGRANFPFCLFRFQGWVGDSAEIQMLVGFWNQLKRMDAPLDENMPVLNFVNGNELHCSWRDEQNLNAIIIIFKDVLMGIPKSNLLGMCCGQLWVRHMFCGRDLWWTILTPQSIWIHCSL